MLAAKIILSVVLVGFIGLFVHLYNVLVLKPKRNRSKLQSQGIRGPSPSFFYGNIPEMVKIQRRHQQLQNYPSSPKDHRGEGDAALAHDWPAAVFSHIEEWRQEYGPVFMYSTGNIQILCITEPEMAKEVGLHTSLNLGKPSYLSKDRGPLLGQGILTSSGPYWAHQRKIISPEFYLDKVKDMVNLMVDSTLPMLESWGSKAEKRGGYAEIKIDESLRRLSADIISRASFGSNYAQGENIFLKLRALQEVMSKGNIGVPGSRYVPSKNNREIWRLEKEINTMIVQVVRSRREAESERDRDLLQSILEAAKEYEDTDGLPPDITLDKFIVDNCKNIYFAGHETTATSATWCLILLAAYPEWQSRTRAEVLKVCGDKLPDADMLRSMKMLTMVIQETLRLYPPVAYMVRETMQDMKFKDIEIPKGTNLQIVKPILHQNPDIWGPDVHQFNPERFADGSRGACKVPQAYVPFGAGPRICLGQHFAMQELKVILSLILSRFSFTLSPEYRHAPAFKLVIEPKHGAYLHVRRL